MPSLLSRLTLATKALTGAYSAGTAGPYGFLGGVFPGSVGDPPVRGTLEQLQAYSTTPWARTVIEKIASAFAALEWKLYVQRAPRRGTLPGKVLRNRGLQRAAFERRKAVFTPARMAAESIQEITAHPFLDEVLDSGNSVLTGLACRKVTMIHFESVGEFFWLKERNGAGVPVGVWPLPPNWILNRPTPGTRQFRVSYRGWQAWIPDTEILWVANPNPVNPYGTGTGMVRVLGDELESDEYAAKMIKQTFFNQARPDLIVMPADDKTQIGDPERLRFERSWLDKLQGYLRQYKPTFLSRKVEIWEGTRSYRDLQLAQLRGNLQDVVLQAWGIPPEMLGKTQNSNRAVAEAAEYLFTRWLLVPRAEFFRAAMQELMLPEYDANLILDYVSPVQEDRAHGLDVAAAAPWALTMDEWRQMMGLPPLADGQGTIHLVSTLLQPTDFGAPGMAPKGAAFRRAATPEDQDYLRDGLARVRARRRARGG